MLSVGSVATQRMYSYIDVCIFRVLLRVVGFAFFVGALVFVFLNSFQCFAMMCFKYLVACVRCHFVHERLLAASFGFVVLFDVLWSLQVCVLFS